MDASRYMLYLFHAVFTLCIDAVNVLYDLSLTVLLFPVSERTLIEHYFWDGFRYSSIVRFLSEYHGLHISIRTLRRRLRDYGLSRRNAPPALMHVWNAIHSELSGPGLCKISLDWMSLAVSYICDALAYVKYWFVYWLLLSMYDVYLEKLWLIMQLIIARFQSCITVNFPMKSDHLEIFLNLWSLTIVLFALVSSAKCPQPQHENILVCLSDLMKNSLFDVLLLLH